MRKLTLLLILPLLIIVLIPGIKISANTESSSSKPGSVDDPVITKSYLEQNLKQIILDEIKKQNLKLENAPNNEPNSNNDEITPSSTSSNNLKIIKLDSGQSLYGGSGTEFIVRTGKTVVFSNDESGIADVTIGKDIIAGQAVELNHMLIVPREGRGIKPDPKNNQEIYVMVRGNYLLTNADGSKVSP